MLVRVSVPGVGMEMEILPMFVVVYFSSARIFCLLAYAH